MSPKKKLITGVSAAVTPPGLLLVWHIGEKLHTLQWFLHLAENKYVRLVWDLLGSPSGQTVLLLGAIAVGWLIYRELRARRKNATAVAAPPKTDVATPKAAPVIQAPAVTPVSMGRTKVKRLTRKKQTTITDSFEIVEEEQPVETNV